MLRKKEELKKHIATIHCSNTLTLMQRKISNALLYHAYPELKSQEEYQISMGQLCKIIGYSGHNYQAIKESLRGLITTLIEWDLSEEIGGTEDWTASTILSSVRIRGSICTYSYSPRMRELLYSPAIYGNINLIIQSKFKSSYGLALYENCSRYRGLSQTKWFEYETFRKLMGVSKEKYIIFRDFKKRVIEQSVFEVNEYSDLEIIPEMKKFGKQISHIRFKINNKQSMLGLTNMFDNNLKEKRSEVGEHSIFNTLINFGFKEVRAKKIINKYEETYLKEKIKFVLDSNVYKTGKIKNISGFLYEALKENYKDKVQIKELEQKQSESLNLKEYQDYVSDSINSVFNDFSKEEQIQLLSRFELYLDKNDPVSLVMYRKSGFGDNIVNLQFRRYVLEHEEIFQENIKVYKTWSSETKNSL